MKEPVVASYGWISAVGWAGQACFFARTLTQWLASERVKKSVTPADFWLLSIVGSACTVVYAWFGPAHDAVLTSAAAFNLAVYGRSARIAGGRATRLGGGGIVGLAAFAAVAAFVAARSDPRVAFAWDERSFAWAACGLIGQAAWNGRFLVQWVAAERRGDSALTPVFFRLG